MTALIAFLIVLAAIDFANCVMNCEFKQAGIAAFVIVLLGMAAMLGER